uniref:Caprin-1 dimerization domain-containing protein n=1 Tax=Sipha flava TaxID=143950 RepID=A0A2S2QD77_9HEMI
MVSPKRCVEEGKPLFEDQLKTVSKHYVKLIESKPNIVAGTSYANLKECLLKIERSGYLDCIVKNVDKEVEVPNEVNNLETQVSQTVNQPIVSNDDHIPDNVPNSGVPNVEYTANKIETIYFTNNNISGNTVEQKTYQNRNDTESVLNTSFDFLQDSLLEEDHVNVNLDSIPTQTFSSSLYTNNGPTDEAILKILSTPPQHHALNSVPYKESKLNHLGNVVNVSNSNSWTGKSEVNWQNRTETVDSNNLPRENWSMAQMISNTTNNDWLIKNNWVQMAEEDKQQEPPNQPSQKNSSNFGLVTNGI